MDSQEHIVQTLHKLTGAFSEDGGLDDPAAAPELVQKLKAVEQAVRNHGLISPNEDFAEIHVEYTPILHLPFYIATAYQNSSAGDRSENLRNAEKYYLTFLELLSHYDILPAQVQKIREAYLESKKYSMEREVKIQLFKDEKAAKDKIALAKNKEDPREAQRQSLIVSSFKTVNSLLYLPQELELLAYRQKLETDPETKAEYERSKNKPVEPIKFWKLDSTTQEATSGTIQSKDIRTQEGKSLTGFAHDGSLGIAPVKTTNLNEILDQKQLIKDRLNQPGWTQPTRTLDEHDQMEYDLMMQKQRRNDEQKAKRESEKKKFGIEDSEDSENEMVSEAKTYKARNWDDWKDENEKGSGNRNGR